MRQIAPPQPDPFRRIQPPLEPIVFDPEPSMILKFPGSVDAAVEIRVTGPVTKEVIDMIIRILELTRTALPEAEVQP